MSIFNEKLLEKTEKSRFCIAIQEMIRYNETKYAPIDRIGKEYAMQALKNCGFRHKAGVIMSVSSLPGKYGIGSFGKAAHDFVDFLDATGQKCWQVLPLNPTSYGDSPYQSPSSVAGNPYFIDLEILAEKG